jgi:cell fate (sporulation/competence/biofilm development) regulator YlbF (YheA/YmcA/DUF963 family)
MNLKKQARRRSALIRRNADAVAHRTYAEQKQSMTKAELVQMYGPSEEDWTVRKARIIQQSINSAEKAERECEILRHRLGAL